MNETERYSYEEAAEEGFHLKERMDNDIIQDYSTAEIIAEYEKSPDIKLTEVSFEELSEITSVVGTITHVTSPKKYNQEISPLSYWFEIAHGNTPESNGRPEDPAISFNYTLPNRRNLSITGPDNNPWCLKSEKYNNPLSLVVLSENANKRIGGVGDAFYFDNVYPKDAERFFGQAIRCYSQEEFSDFLAKRLTDYQFYSDHIAAGHPWLQLQAMCYSLMALYDQKLLTSCYYMQDLNKSAADWLINAPQLGFRYRGAHQRPENQLGRPYIWENLTPHKKDIAAIITPLKAGEKYLLARFIDNPSLGNQF